MSGDEAHRRSHTSGGRPWLLGPSWRLYGGLLWSAGFLCAMALVDGTEGRPLPCVIDLVEAGVLLWAAWRSQRA
jgi:hypothetical protein